MVITDLTESECYGILAQEMLARLACSHDNQAYIVPMYFALEGSCLYGFSTPGLKSEWMRLNPLVCVEVDQIRAYNDWTSVVVFGRFEELPSSSGDREWDQEQRRAHPPGAPLPAASADKSEALRAHDLLQARHPEWLEPGVASSIHRKLGQPFEAIYYRIGIDRVSGRRALPGADLRLH